MSTKTISNPPASLKRIIIDYSKNVDLDYIFSQLESIHFPGLSKAEITKLAIIQLFKVQQVSAIPNLTNLEEKSLASAMDSKDKFTTLKTDLDVKSFTTSLLD